MGASQLLFFFGLAIKTLSTKIYIHTISRFKEHKENEMNIFKRLFFRDGNRSRCDCLSQEL